MDTLIGDLLKGLPNLAVAVAVLYWQKQTIDKLLEHQRSLLDKLIEMVTRAENIAAQSAASSSARIYKAGGD